MKVDHKYTDEIVCPNCGYKFSSSYKYFPSNDECCDDIHCDECDTDFDAVRNISISYTTIRKDTNQ